MHVGISMTHTYIPYTEENRKRSIKQIFVYLSLKSRKNGQVLLFKKIFLQN